MVRNACAVRLLDDVFDAHDAADGARQPFRDSTSQGRVIVEQQALNRRTVAGNGPFDQL